MKQDIIAVVGLGYVGLPLAVEFGKLFTCIGYDIDNKRVDELSNGIDKTLEVYSAFSFTHKLIYDFNSIIF